MKTIVAILALSGGLLKADCGLWSVNFGLTPQEAPGATPLSLTTVGIEGKVIFRHRGDQPLRAAPVNDQAKITLRIAQQEPDGEFVLYDLRYIPQYAGEFDLREYLERLDGMPLADAEPIPVKVGALLAADHGSDLFEIDGVAAPRLGGYRLALIITSSLWVVPIAYLILRRILRKNPAVPAAVDRPLTLGDQLKPLVQAALTGTISTADRAKLEMLLVTYWRDQLNLRDHAHFDALQPLRDHPEAGAILGLMESWLHRPASRNGEAIDLASLLARYRDVEAIHLPEMKEVHA